MIMGWHHSAVSFVKKHEQELSKITVAYFLTAMSLTKYNQQKLGETLVFVDPKLAKSPKNGNRPSYKERYATVEKYLQPVLQAAPEVRPVSVGFFGGKLDLSRLNWWQKLFVQQIIRARPGDYRNWPFIKEWSARLGSQL